MSSQNNIIVINLLIGTEHRRRGSLDGYLHELHVALDEGKLQDVSSVGAIRGILAQKTLRQVAVKSDK